MDPSQYQYPSPLEGYEHLPPLPEYVDRDGEGPRMLTNHSEKTEDGKSYVNPQTGVLSKAYESFVDPIDNGTRGGFDIHIYFYQENKTQSKFARDLWTRIRHEFPELRIYRVWDKPIGPHPIAMFEVNVFRPAQFGAFIAWLVINRGPLSALVHPNTGDDEVSKYEAQEQ
ncbi:hypothetical protein OEA41_001477 [Lepraria neglecta]|uniref:DOPA-like domain-containing protein n=1 Tax=Lepraria neglecta TaxID=209136 RepID=A0AAD9ZAR6_9LECA|nr:hypothetical protein OEA41_001477 [Lepraria neglecta]